MKQLFTLATALFLGFGLSAQITATIADFGSIGDMHLVGHDTLATPGQIVSSAGPSQTWDYSALNFHAWDTLEFHDPATLPSGGTFPGANLAITTSAIEDYVIADANGVTLIGRGVEFGGLTVPTGMIDNLQQWQLPLNYLNAWVDTGRVDTIIDGSFTGVVDSVRNIRWHTIDALVDGWGTLTTVNGTYDVLRVKTIEVVQDTVWGKFPSIGWQLIGTELSNLNKYYYLANNEDYPVLELHTSATDEIEAAFYKIGAAPLAQANAQSHASCNGTCDGSAVAQAAAGSMPYTYLWNDPSGQTTSTATGLCAGNYDVTVTDALGASTTAMATVTEPSALVVDSVLQVDETMAGNDGAISISGSGGTPSYSYLWSTGDTTQNLSNLIGGTYTITITDSTGCTGTRTFNLGAAPTIIIASATMDALASCSGSCDGEATASATGGLGSYTYAWGILPVQTSATATGLCPGTYVVAIGDSTGSTDTATVTITAPPAIVIDSLLQVNESVAGNDGAISIDVSGGTPGYSYLWSNGDITQNLANLIGGTYTITVTDTAGCTNTRSFTLTGTTPFITASASADAHASCNSSCDGSATATATGGVGSYTYAWAVSPPQSTATVTGLCLGNYTVIVSDSMGTIDTATVTITAPAVIVVDSILQVNESVAGNDGAITIDVTGGTPGYSYLWSNGDTMQNLAGLIGGTYTVTVTDTNGCIGTHSFTLTTASTIVTASATADAPTTCNGTCDGVATATGTGGLGLYTYAWSTTPPQSTATATGLCPGNYTVTISDSTGTTDTATVTIIAPPLIVIDSVLQVNESLAGNDGAITIDVTGGTPGYSYLWSNGDTTLNLANLVGGTYTIVVTDTNGCTATRSFTLTSASPFVTASATADATTSCIDQCDGVATASATGGFGPYTYAWAVLPAQLTATATGLCAGNHTVTVTDATGSSDTATVTITTPPNIVIDSILQVNESFLGGDGSLDIEPAGGVGGFTYSWSNGETTQDIQNLVGGTYTVSATDSNGCENKRTFTLSSAVGIAENVAHKPQLSVWPVPANDYIVVKHEAAGTPVASIYNLLGEAMRTVQLTGATTRLDVSGLKQGIYFIRLGAGVEATATRLIIAGR